MYKVLHIFSGYGGGISSLILNLIENSSDDFHFDLMAFAYENADVFLTRVKKKNCEVFTMPSPRRNGFIKFERYINNIIEQGSYDVVHCHISGWESLFYSTACKRNGVKNFIIHSHYTLSSSSFDRIRVIHKFNQYINFASSNAYMTCSDLAANYVFGPKYLIRRPAAMIPNGIKVDLYKNTLTTDEIVKFRNEFNILPGQIVIGHVGRFNTQKNHEFIIDIAEKLNNPNFVFVLVGTGDRYTNICNLIKEKKLDGCFRLIGRRDDVQNLMQFFDIMILPSFYEGLPTVAIECQAAGTPMLISDTVTKQCDMQLGLVRFLKLDSVNDWVKELVIPHKKISICDSINKIDNMGFTAEAAGKIYCKELLRLINENN